MQKKNVAKICFAICILLIAAFVIKSIVDYTQYSPIFTSAPFYVNIIVNAAYFVAPAIILFITGFILRKKQ